MEIEDFDYQMALQGYVKVDQVLSADTVMSWADGLDAAINRQRQMHHRGEFAHVLHTESPVFLHALENPPLWPLVRRMVGEEAILHSFGGVRLLPETANPIQNAIHRDTPRFFRPQLLSCQTLIMLDDFTTENGATWVLPGSHQIPGRPTEEQFARFAIQITGSPGDVVLFDSLLWHRGGSNRTAAARRGLTMVFTRSFVKPQFDMPRTVSVDDLARLGPTARQLLGLRSDPPRSLEEYLLPESRRTYVARD